MKKIIFVLLTSIFGVTGCDTLTTIGGAMYEYQRSYDTYVEKHGAPTSSYKETNGTTVYSHIRNCDSSNGQEETLVVVDKENAIIQIKTIRSCPTK